MKNPLVSVVIPVLNGEKFIIEAVRSIVSQTYENLELIIINDGSTDRTRDMVNSINDSRIKILDNPENIGTAISTNKGIAVSKGKYIALMDADDISLPERIERQVAFLENNPEYGVCGTGSKYLGSDVVVEFPSSNDEIRVAMLQYFPFRNPSLMMRKSILDKFQLRYDPAFKLTLDYEFISRLIPYCKVANLSEVMLLYREHEKQTSRVYHEVFIEHANNVKVFQLERNLQISLSDKEKSLYVQIFNRNYSWNEEQLLAIIKLFLKLEKANEKVAFYNSNIFKDFLLSIDPRVKMFVYNRRFNLDLFFKYYFSKTKPYQFIRKEFGFIKELQFIVKCFLFWKVKRS